MAKDTLIYSRLIEIPETIGTQYYKTQITTDKNFEFLSGILCMLHSGSVEGKDIEIEIRDDYRALFSFSPSANWIKTADNSGWDMTQLFRPCNLPSKGKNIYINVKATDCDAFSFAVYLKQTHCAIRCIDYNFQSYDIVSNSNNVIALPTNYTHIRGVQISLPGSVVAPDYQLRIEDASGNLIDDIMCAAINVHSYTHYDKSFMPVNFPGDARDVKIYLTKIDGTTAADPVKAKICFLVCNVSN